jgi:hypothetical protein
MIAILSHLLSEVVSRGRACAAAGGHLKGLIAKNFFEMFISELWRLSSQRGKLGGQITSI